MKKALCKKCIFLNPINLLLFTTSMHFFQLFWKNWRTDNRSLTNRWHSVRTALNGGHSIGEKITQATHCPPLKTNLPRHPFSSWVLKKFVSRSWDATRSFAFYLARILSVFQKHTNLLQSDYPISWNRKWRADNYTLIPCQQTSPIRHFYAIRPHELLWTVID